MLPSLREIIRMAPPKGASGEASNSWHEESFQGVLPKLSARSMADTSLPQVTNTVANFIMGDSFGSSGYRSQTMNNVVTRDFIPEPLSLPGVAGSGMRRPPPTPRTARRRKNAGDGKRLKNEGMVESHRLLRCKNQGEWDADLFLELRRGFEEEGRWNMASVLRQLAAEASMEACRASHYNLSAPRKGVALLPGMHVTHWLGYENLKDYGGEKYMLTPPMICTEKRPLELVEMLKAQFPKHPLVMSFDATDFTTDGNLAPANESRGVAQQEILIRTNLEAFQKNANLFCQSHNPKQHMTAAKHPFVLGARNVTLFRGNYEDGYPFWSSEEQLSLNMVVSSRSSPRIRMGKGDNFLLKSDADACSERLELLALAAISLAEEEHLESVDPNAPAEKSVSGDAEMRLPVLIISMHDLGVAGNPQPRKGIADLLKDWRQLYADSFEAVVLACGDKGTALIFDKCVNSPIYASVLIDPSRVPDWHWNEKVVALSVNELLIKIRRNRPQAEDKTTKARTTRLSCLEQHAVNAKNKAQAADSNLHAQHVEAMPDDTEGRILRSNSKESQGFSQDSLTGSGSHRCGSAGSGSHRRGSAGKGGHRRGSAGSGSQPGSDTSRLTAASSCKVEKESSRERHEKLLHLREVDTHQHNKAYNTEHKEMDKNMRSSQKQQLPQQHIPHPDSGMEAMHLAMSQRNANPALAFEGKNTLETGHKKGKEPKAGARRQSWMVQQSNVMQLSEDMKAEITACLQEEKDADDIDVLDIKEEFAEIRQLALQTAKELDKKRSRMQCKNAAQQHAKDEQSHSRHTQIRASHHKGVAAGENKDTTGPEVATSEPLE